MPSSIAIPKNYLEKVNNEYKLVDVVKDYIKKINVYYINTKKL